MTRFVVVCATLIHPSGVVLWAAALLLWATQALAAPAHKPLVPQGEPVLDVLRATAGISRSSPLYDVAFSPDATRLATASYDRTVSLWDPATGRHIATLEGHSDSVRSVTFSPDGKRLASASDDRTVRLWDADTGQYKATLEGHTASVRSIAFSPDGALLASASEDRSVRLWNPATGQPVAILEGHANAVYSVAFSPDGKRLASASSDLTIRLWNPATEQHISTLEGHSDSVRSVAFSPDGECLASASSDRTVRLWNPATGQTLSTLEGQEGHSLTVRSLSFSRDGKHLASASDDGTVRLWNPATAEVLATLEGHTASVLSVAYSPSGKRIASVSNDGTARLWDPATAKILATLEGHSLKVVSAVFSPPDGKLLASTSGDRRLRLWDSVDGQALITLEGHSLAIRSLAFSPDGKRLASASSDRTVRLWDPATGQRISTLQGHSLTVRSVAFSPDGQRLASASDDRTVRLWDLASGEEIASLEGHSETVRSVAFSKNGRLLASASDDRSVRLWDPYAAQHIDTLEGHTAAVLSLAFSPDGKYLASGSEDRTTRLWDLDTKQSPIVLKGCRFFSVAFSPDGGLLASASPDGNVRLWDPATGEQLDTLEGHSLAARSVAFSPDGKHLTSASDDGTVRVWDLANRRLTLFTVVGRNGHWAACRTDDGLCWRYDDGTLLWFRDAHYPLVPIPLTRPAASSQIKLAWLPIKPGQKNLSLGDGKAHPLILQVENLGPSHAYWLRIGQEPQPSSPFLFYPPAVRIKLDSGESAELETAVSYSAGRDEPAAVNGTLRLRLEQANGDNVPLEIPVHGRAPKLMLAGEPEQSKGDVPAVTARVRNVGEQDLEEAEFRARISGVEKPLARVTEDAIPAGAEIALSFALPENTVLTKDSLLTLEARERSYPPHTWNFADRPIRFPVPPWQLYAGLATLLIALSILLWYLRQYTHPLTRRLAAEPAALPRLGLEELDKARGLLKHTRRLGTVLSASGIHVRWLDQALRFRESPPEARVKWLAERLGADWQPMEGLGADGAIEQFEVGLGDNFPLNLRACSLFFPPGDWPDQEIFTSLGTGGDQVRLILSSNPDQQAALSRRCRTSDNWLVAPEEGELSMLLLSPEPVDAVARLIASYVKVAHISPYRIGGGVRKESAFFGRVQTISDIQHREPANYLLVGGRQLGKSSLLLALRRHYDVDDEVDCLYLSVGKATIESRLARVLGMPSSSSLEEVLDRLAGVETGRRRLLLIDEADIFLQQDAKRGNTCLNGFRSLSDEGRCQFILAGFWNLYRSASFDYQSPIKNFAESIVLGALEPDACRDMVVKPMAALNLSYESDAMVQRILDLTGGRANLIAIICDQMLHGLGLARRALTDTDLERALESRSLLSSLEGWTNLSGDDEADRLDRLIVFGLIAQEKFALAEVLDLLKGLGYEVAPEQVKESLTRLELAFIVGRSQNRYRWQVPLWREQVLAEEPASMLERELQIHSEGK